MCLRWSCLTCYGLFMTTHTTSTLPMRRRPAGADDSSQSAGRREADVLKRSLGDVSVRELLVAGALRGFNERELFA